MEIYRAVTVTPLPLYCVLNTAGILCMLKVALDPTATNKDAATSMRCFKKRYVDAML